ncbi:hypothetical protein AB4K20DRAFT_1912025 [Rhizopus microsporus]
MVYLCASYYIRVLLIWFLMLLFHDFFTCCASEVTSCIFLPIIHLYKLCYLIVFTFIKIKK